MAKKDSAVKARQRARERMAAKLAEQRKREEANEADLARFFETEESLTKAAHDRDAAIDKARRDYEKATSKVTSSRAESLAAMRDRGESVADLATLTGLTTREVNALLKTTRGGTTTHTLAPATDTSGQPSPAPAVPDTDTDTDTSASDSSTPADALAS
ncbi:MAG: hypothetical protein ACRDTD_28110 [Pseudonocardiaceae bacterium]